MVRSISRANRVSFKSAIKQCVPPPLLSVIVRLRLRQEMHRSNGRTHEQIFSSIYERRAWGGAPSTWSSGCGSHEQLNDPYIDLVLSLMESEKVARVVDLGCGDFRIGRRIAGHGAAYVGCDVVPGVIEHVSRTFGRRGIEFRTIDMVSDPLPRGDLCIIRQVFQHLSNDSISAVLRKTRDYRLVLVTDEQVRGDDASSNVDILPFEGTRRVFGQGLRLERPPFDEKIEALLEHSSGIDYGLATATYLRTVLIRHPRPA